MSGCGSGDGRVAEAAREPNASLEMTDTSQGTSTAIDPVCGMTVTVGKAAATREHEGVTYHFCCHGCAEKFTADPNRYLKPKAAADAPVPLGRRASLPIAGTAAGSAHAHHGAASPHGAAKAVVEYTCPMHPEVVRPAPGPCPFCGMALEPRVATGDDANPELAS